MVKLCTRGVLKPILSPLCRPLSEGTRYPPWPWTRSTAIILSPCGFQLHPRYCTSASRNYFNRPYLSTVHATNHRIPCLLGISRRDMNRKSRIHPTLPLANCSSGGSSALRNVSHERGVKFNKGDRIPSPLKGYPRVIRVPCNCADPQTPSPSSGFHQHTHANTYPFSFSRSQLPGRIYRGMYTRASLPYYDAVSSPHYPSMPALANYPWPIYRGRCTGIGSSLHYPWFRRQQRSIIVEGLKLNLEISAPFWFWIPLIPRTS